MLLVYHFIFIDILCLEYEDFYLRKQSIKSLFHIQACSNITKGRTIWCLTRLGLNYSSSFQHLTFIVFAFGLEYIEYTV